MRGAGDNTDWKALFMGLVDGTIVGDVTLDNSVTTIKDYTFYNCTSLTSVTAPNVVTVKPSAFNGAVALKTATLGTLQEVGISAFMNCRALETPVIVGNNVTTLGNTVFINCTKVPYVDVGTGVTSIGNQCFRYLTACQYIIMRPTSPPTLGLYNFIEGSTGSYPIYVPDASVNNYKAANNWSALASRIFPLSDIEP